MSAAQQIVLSARSEAFEGVLPDHAEHGEPGLCLGATLARLPIVKKALVQQRFHALHRIGHQILVAAHSLDRLHGAPAEEHAYAGEESLFILLQEVIAPLYRIAEGLVTGREVARPAGEQLEAVIQPR